MAWPFKRRKSTDQVPAEIQQYYQSERRERVGMAWLLGFFTFLVSIAVVLGLFLGGRWIYRTLTNQDEGATPVETIEVDEGTEDSPVSTSSPSGPTPAPQPTTPAPVTGGDASGSDIPRTGPDLDL